MWTFPDYIEYLSNLEFKTFVTNTVVRGMEDDRFIIGDDWFFLILAAAVLIVVVTVNVVTKDWVCTLTCTHKVPLPEPSASNLFL
jgi:hypothetical protein